MDAPQDEPDRIVPTGERPFKPQNLMEQPLSPEDERIVSANPSPGAAIIGPSRDVARQPEASDATGDPRVIYPVDVYASQGQTIFYSGYGNNTGTWNGYSQFVNADGLQTSPAIYNDNPSLMFHSGYGFNPEMAFGQYSPVATPMPSVMVEGQLYQSQQIPFSPSYYPQPALTNVPSPVPPSELMGSESGGDNFLFGQGSGYFLHFGPFGGENVSMNPSSGSLTSTVAYPQPMGILGSYEQSLGQRQLHGFGFSSSSSTTGYPHGSSYQNSNFVTASSSQMATNDRNRFSLDKGRRRERDQDSICISNDSHSIDRNRGPRASKLKGKVVTENNSSSGSKNHSLTSGINLELYNRLDFPVDYENAKFFIIKSFSEDNVHKSIKYNVWASTPHGNKKLDAAYNEAKKIEGNCPVFLFFSVNASGQFCGVAKMVGPVDFENDADYWQQDRWSGQFPVQWHIIKDVPNSRFRHILLENNDNKPVTHSRDSQEVQLEQGLEMLKIFKDHEARTCILDDFNFYNEREKTLKERKTKLQVSSTRDAVGLLIDESINQISDSFGEALQLEEGSTQKPASETGDSSRIDKESIKQNRDSFSQALKFGERNDKQASEAADMDGGHKN